MKMDRSALKHKLKKGLLAFTLAGSIGVMAACGESGRKDTVKEWVYVPEFVDIKDENIPYYDVHYSGDSLYYISSIWEEETEQQGSDQTPASEIPASSGWYEETGTFKEYLCRYSLTDGSVTKVLLDWGEQGKQDSNLGDMAFAPDGSMCAVVRSYSYDEATQTGTSKSGLAKFGADGKLLFSQDLMDKLDEGSRNGYVYINGIAVDGEGRIYIAGESKVVLFDGDGTYKGTVSVGNGMESRIQSIGAGSDGKVYVSNFSYSADSAARELIEIDFAGQKAGTAYGNLPDRNSEGLTPGAEEGTFLINDGSTLYEYRLADQTKTALFDWLDSDINGNYVRGVGAMADGRIVALINDWYSEENSGVAMLTKTKGSEVAQKETILIGTLSNASELQASAVNFNRSSDKYHITIKQYMDNSAASQESYQTALQDAITSLNNDLTSKANCPDIIDLNLLNITQLASKGLLEDLGQYLDKSSALKRSDFVENVLRGYTYGDVLACIPKSFELSTIIGKTSDVGEKQGWTLQELVAYADKHPGAQLFDNISKQEIMYYLLVSNEDSFIDWSAGKCSFDSDEFKSLLAFVNRFPSEVSYDSQASTPTKIQKGEVLLQTAGLYDFDEIQMYSEIFGGEYTCKGLPAADGSSGTLLLSSGLYGITSKAAQKEGAWEFLESYLTQDNDMYSYGFPSRKEKLDEMAKKAVTVEYMTDQNGDLVLDGNGDPIETGSGGMISYSDGWSYTYRKATQAEVDLIMQLIDKAKPVNLGSTQILEIVNEEAAGYFEGQKSVDEVAKVIQNRVQLYVDVNN